MPCIAAPQIPFPALPSPLSLGLNLATPALSGTFCCTFSVPSFPIPLPPINLGMLGAAAIAAIQGYLQVTAKVNAFLAALQLTCPLN